MEPFASNLRKRAEELGISNAEAARRVGLSERRYGNYISGRREPDLATLVKIATVLETSPDRLLSFGQEEGASIIGPKQRILAATNVLPNKDLEMLAIMVEALASQRSKPSEG
jgi:transcriptional regulator with XRE-family HTH domain